MFSKKKQESKKEKGGPPGYPSQPAYPTQGGGYPSQATAPPPGGQPPPYTPQQPAGAGPPGPPMYSYQPPQGPPQGYPGQQPAYYPQAPMYGGGYPQGMQQPYGAYAMPQIPQGAQVVGHGQYDAGARFNSGAGMNVPPPPPGCMPNAAQISAMHGGTVHMSQGRAGFFTTSSDGGVSTHID